MIAQPRQGERASEQAFESVGQKHKPRKQRSVAVFDVFHRTQSGRSQVGCVRQIETQTHPPVVILDHPALVCFEPRSIDWVTWHRPTLRSHRSERPGMTQREGIVVSHTAESASLLLPLVFARSS